MKRSWLTISAHIAGWLFFFSLVAGFVAGTGQDAWPGMLFSKSFLGFSLLYLLLFYLNTFVLIPFIYLREKYILYALVSVGLLAAIMYFKPFDKLMTINRNERADMPGPPPGQMPAPPPPQWENKPGPQMPSRNQPPQNGRPGKTDIVSTILFLAVWSLGLAICIIRQWRITEKKMLQAEADRANAELSFLKAQINPHFLFNTLNNTYSLAVTGSEHTALSVMKLSNIMRYLTDDVRADFVWLEDELDFLRDYIDLQKLRLGANTEVRLITKGEVAGKRIAPLILVAFVENVFKYGVSKQQASVITISVEVKNDRLFFHTDNPLFPDKKEQVSTGIGIDNTRQRLQHLYQQQYDLSVGQENGRFVVNLELPVPGSLV